MKKLFLLLALSAICTGALAQDLDLDINQISLSREDAAVEAELEFALPMYFGWTALTGVNYKGAWDYPGRPDFLDTRTGKNFVYGLEMAAVHFSKPGGSWDVSLGLRWTFMDFTLRDSQWTFRKVIPYGVYADAVQTGVEKVYFPYSIKAETPNYNGRKSKIHGNYIGMPLRVTYKTGDARIFAGASAEYLLNGYSKYRSPKNRQDVTPMFNRFRATIEAGVSYSSLGIFVLYGLTPLFPAELSDARTLTIGLLLDL